MRLKKLFAILCVLAGLAFTLPGLWAEETEYVDPTPPPRRIMVFFRNDATNFAPDEKIAFYESLLIALQRSKKDCYPVEASPIAGPDSDDDRSSFARRKACDGWLLVRVKAAGEDQTSVDFVLFDVVNDIFVAKSSFTLDKPDARDLSIIFWEKITDAYLTLKPLDPLPTLTIRGVPGTVVYGLGKKALTIDANGRTRITVQPIPAVFSIRAEKTGYDTLEQDILIKEMGGDIKLEQKRGSLFSLDLTMLSMQFPGIDVGFYPIPNLLFFKLGFTTFQWGIYLGDFQDNKGAAGNNHSVIVHYPLMNLSFQAGVYISDPGKTVRTYLALGAFARLFFSDAYTGLEPIAPYGLQPVFGMEFHPVPSSCIFLEYAPSLYYVDEADSQYTKDFELLKTLYPKGHEWYTFSQGRWVCDMLVFRVGYRWHL